MGYGPVNALPGISMNRAIPLALLLPLLAACTDDTEKAADDGTAEDGTADGGDGTSDGGDGTSDGGDGSGEDGGGDDGMNDGDDPLYGPENAWPHANLSDVPPDLEGTGRGVGDVLPNFAMTDQNGEDVELYQFYGRVVQLVLFAEWCGPCKEEAPAIEAAFRNLSADGVMVISVMMEQNDGSTPDVAAVNRWVDAYDGTHAHLVGPANLAGSIEGGYPTLPVLRRDMTVATTDNFPFSEDYLAGLAAE